MEIRFRDVNKGIVEARATIEVAPGIFINEVTVLKKGKDVEIEIPQKSFRGNDGKVHFVDIITFESEQKKVVWLLAVKDEYLSWREQNKTVLVYNME